jgi:DNA-binding NarL/FixJ family response regulator
VSSSSETSVLVLAIGESPAPELLRMAVRNAWSVRQFPSARAAFAETLRCRPVAAIVQVATKLDESLELIRRVRAGSWPVLLVAVAVAHREEVERAARVAGVDCYVGTTADSILAETIVAELLERQKHAAPVARTVQRGGIGSDTLLLPDSSRQSGAVGVPPPPPHRQGGAGERIGPPQRPACQEGLGQSHHKGA